MKLPSDSAEDCSKPQRLPPAAFLLAQVGAHAAAKFAVRLAEIELAPPHAGILRIVAARPAITQQALATALGSLPSRLVALVDELESRGLVERQTSEVDRRRNALHLTEKGMAALQAIGPIARDHQQALLAALSEKEQVQLSVLLQRVADEQGLRKGVHPGYSGPARGLGNSKPRRITPRAT